MSAILHRYVTGSNVKISMAQPISFQKFVCLRWNLKSLPVFVSLNIRPLQCGKIFFLRFY